MAENMLKEVTISAAAANQDWSATVVTLFPEMFPGSLGLSLAGKALDDGLWSIDTVDIRDFAVNNQQTVDDAPFGGGVGMVMRADVIDAALMSVKKSNQLSRIYVTPRGTPLTQTRVKELAASAGVVILCGRYEGIDNRVLDAWDIEEISFGDNDTLAGMVVGLIDASKFIMLTDQIGICTNNPNIDGSARLVSEINIDKDDPLSDFISKMEGEQTKRG